jgi:hypothetical protein
MSAIIKQQAQKTCQAPLGIQTYRQVAIAIAKRHVNSITVPFDLYSSIDSTTPNPWKSMARQTGHTVQTLATSYAIDKAYPTRLQPELIYQYEEVSRKWHQWLRMDELEAKLQAHQLQSGSKTRPQPVQQTRRPKPQKRILEGSTEGQGLNDSNKRRAVEATLVSKQPSILPLTPPPTSPISKASVPSPRTLTPLRPYLRSPLRTIQPTSSLLNWNLGQLQQQLEDNPWL